MSATVPPGGMCGPKPCWKVSGSGALYKNTTLSTNGLSEIKLKGDPIPGKALLQVKGKGPNLPVPTMPFSQDPSVIMQLVSDAGVCWETTFAPSATKNLPTQFDDKTD
jgi:hypothetical protein